MMNKIHILSDKMINVIAAGEVIERPASVVKELIENAIDAQAHDIRIYVKHAGIEEIKVIDDGIGIPSDEMAIAIKAHSTSKVSRTSDIFKLRTMGFRGEALASITEVSKFKIESQTAGSLGKLISGAGGQITVEKDISKNQGTSVTISDLFFNTPVRLKYLKTISTELRHITEIVQRIAMSQPSISFSLYANGKEILRTAGKNNFRQTVAGIYGIEVSRNLIEISGKDDDFSINGLISMPSYTRANRRNINFSVNGRAVKSLELTRYLLEGYQTKLMVERFPTAIILIKLDPQLIDVNIHPAKQQLKISKVNQLGNLIEKTVSSSLAKLDLIPEVKTQEKDYSDIIDPAVEMQQHFESLSHETVNYFTQQKVSHISKIEEESLKSSEPKVKFEVSTPELTEFGDIPLVTPQNQIQIQKWDQFYAQEKKLPSFESNESTSTQKQEINNLFVNQSVKNRFPKLEYVGQVQGTYLIGNTGDGFYLIDQHAAQERINFEYYRQKLGEETHNEQTLLVPLVLEYSQSDYIEIKEKLGLLKQLGLELADFGGSSFIIDHYPSWIKTDQVKDTIKEMIDFVLADRKLSLSDFRLKTAKMISCKQAIKAHQFLADAEAKKLITNLANCKNPFNCPHGRPVLVQISNRDLARMFKRTQDPHLHDLGLSVD